MNRQLTVVLSAFSAGVLLASSAVTLAASDESTPASESQVVAAQGAETQAPSRLTPARVKPDPMILATFGEQSSMFAVKSEDFNPSLQALPDGQPGCAKLKTIDVQATNYPGYPAEQRKICYFPPGTDKQDPDEQPSRTDTHCVDLEATREHLDNYLAGKPFGPGATAWVMHITQAGSRSNTNKKAAGEDSVTFVYDSAEQTSCDISAK
jgi:hypothetical protein